MSWTEPDDRGRVYVLSGDVDDIIRVAGSEQLPCGRKQVATEDGELGPRVFQESLRHGADFPA